MKNFFFPTANRVRRRQFWTVQLANIAIGCLLAVIGFVIGKATNQSTEDGQFAANGASALPMLVFTVAAAAVQLTLLISTIKIFIKRYHDRDKSGAWVFIILVPVIGALWSFIETGFLAGTSGPNRFGPDPRSGLAPLPDEGFSLAR